MELRILGVHNMESKETRLASHLLDGVLALDAGGLTRSLSFEEQRQIRAMLLTHRHFDHIRDLLPFGLSMRDSGVTVELYAIRDTADFIAEKLLDGSIYPNFLESPTPETPVFRINVVDVYQEFKVLGYTAMAVPVPHAVPAAGFQVSSRDTRLFYTGDAGRGVGDALKRVTPDVLLTEVTFGNENQPLALEVGHLTPALLDEALTAFREAHDFMPRVIVVHMNPPWEPAVRKELALLSGRLGIELLVARADMTLTL